MREFAIALRFRVMPYTLAPVGAWQFPDAAPVPGRQWIRWLYLEVTVDHLGHLSIKGHATDRCGVGNCLEFERTETDQTYLKPLIAQLEEVVARFDVRGTPDE